MILMKTSNNIFIRYNQDWVKLYSNQVWKVDKIIYSQTKLSNFWMQSKVASNLWKFWVSTPAWTWSTATSIRKKLYQEFSSRTST